MVFNSLQFVCFFLVVYSLYLMLGHRAQNRMLLVASYVFYGAWDWRFLSLIIVSTILDYTCGLKIYNSSAQKKRRLYLSVSLFGNLSILGFFKYYDFFAQNLVVLLEQFDFSVQPHLLHVILPVGISFYTFQTMSYTIDIYRKEMKPTKKFLDFALFVSFFPQLVAGPIERAKRLLPQILAPRKLELERIYQGCYLIFWGLFLKIFVADNMAALVDPVFSSSGEHYNGVKVLLATYAFAFQIFGDFAGYSNMAIGLGKVMGFDLMLNFNLPYFATNPRDFWKRWHISLSLWLRDYLYIPLGGSRNGTLSTYKNLGITMLLGGLWHGAAWTFVIWGAFHGILLSVHRFLEPGLKRIFCPSTQFGEKLWFLLRVVFFFHLTCFGWLIFRAESVHQILAMLHGLIFDFRFTSGIGLESTCIKLIFYSWILVFVQILQFRSKDLMIVSRGPKTVKTAFYYACVLLMMAFGALGQNQFIYFQF